MEIDTNDANVADEKMNIDDDVDIYSDRKKNFV